MEEKTYEKYLNEGPRTIVDVAGEIKKGFYKNSKQIESGISLIKKDLAKMRKEGIIDSSYEKGYIRILDKIDDELGDIFMQMEVTLDEIYI